MEYVCQFCNKICKPLGFAAHKRLCKKNPEYDSKTHPSYGKEGQNQFTAAANRGETVTFSVETREKISASKKGKRASSKAVETLRLSMKEAAKKYPESYSGKNVNGRAKKEEYNGVLLDSSWEILFAKWCDSLQIKWQRNLTAFEYEWNGKRLYYPDFYLPDFELMIEVKGYERDRDRQKWKAVPRLKVIKIAEIRQIQEGSFSANDLVL